MKRMRKNNTIVLLVILLLSTTVGYALLSTNLKINGLANITKQTWDIHFENINVTNGSVSTQNPATINPNDQTKVSYSIHLENPGDFYEFEVDAVNNGSIDAMITNIESTNNGSSINLPNYIDYKVTYESGTPLDVNHILKANTKETYTVGIYFKSDIQSSDLVNSEPLNLRLKFEVTYKQADENAEEIGDITVTFDPNGGTLSKTTKKVATNGKYGNLPTPTRPGYKFKGWRGYNLLNLYDRMQGQLQGFSNTNQRTFETDKYYVGVTANNYYQESNILQSELSNGIWNIMIKGNATGYGVGFPLSVKPQTKYTFHRISNENNSIGITCYDNTGTWDGNVSMLGGNYTNYTYTTTENCTVMDVVLRPKISNTAVEYSNILVVEGDKVLTYEPYYITKDTKVVRTENFTLTAEWEEE